MNIHHLELFYYVAMHRGVSAAARHIPYGIQQPAISAQIIQLEDSLGVTLFQRRPFALTTEGKELFDHIAPFFNGLPKLANRLRGGKEVRLRIGTPAAIQHDYLPRLLQALRGHFPNLEFTLHSGCQSEFESNLLAGDLDVSITSVFGKLTTSLNHQEMLRLPMALLVPEKSRIKEASDIWKQDRIVEDLICVEPSDALTRCFQHELQSRKIEWYPTLEMGSLDLVVRYVAQGFGIGLVLDQPDLLPTPGTRLIRLTDFPQLSYAVLWKGKITPLIEAFIREAHLMAQELSRLKDARMR